MPETALSDRAAIRLTKDRTIQPPCETAHRPYLLGLNLERKVGVLFRPRCKMWGCPSCARINASFGALRAYSGADQLLEQGHKIYFLTLTSHWKLNAQGSMRVFGPAFNALNRRIKRAAGSWLYFGVPEKHEDGRLHMHFIETAGLGETWLKDNAAECGLGYILDEEEARTPSGAGNYASKYLTKSIGGNIWPKGFRRIRASHAWPDPPPMDRDLNWRFQTLPEISLASVIRAHEIAGFNIYHADDQTAWMVVGAYSDPS